MLQLPKFNTLTFPDRYDEKIIDFKFKEINKMIRVYYKPSDDKERYGFLFYVTEFHSCSCNNFDSYYDDPEFEALCMFYGVVHWDGLRHLHMGDKETDTENYLYYSSTKDLSDIFAKLRELEIEHCNVDQLE